MITLVVLNNPDALFYLIIFPFIPIPAPIVSQPVYCTCMCRGRGGEGEGEGWEVIYTVLMRVNRLC